ncbi:MAG TPA: aminotransferase class I/II-fold pyridoxal phosphate-dependent enzyme [Terriglobales bacterium]|nr:aminotransferase class I/II-fold pyridoxal phosphate-dependent enzyme [Terriglobales bacterium]
MKPHRHRPETEAVRGGTDLTRKNGPLCTPIYQTSTFEVTDNDQQVSAIPTDQFYTRYGNPTNTVAEAAIAELEGADGALLFASGMGAITSAIFALVKAGDHIVAQRDIYGGTTKFLSQWLPKLGVETTFVDTTQYEQYERAIRPNTKLLYLESPTNPTLQIADLNQAAAVASKHQLISMIDSTLATPINQRPVEFGIDLVMHSGTKYFSGHCDLICGTVAGRRDLMDKIQATRTILGGTMDPHAAWLLLRGIKTLAVRVERQNQSALRTAQFLAGHAQVKRVYYPFEQSHPQRALAMDQMRGGGGLLSFEVDGTGLDARRLAESLHLFNLAPSLGGVQSLVTLPVLTSHAMILPEQREKMGVTDQLVRLAVGIENVDDLIADLEQALNVISSTRQHAEVR